ncbi:cysteine dioxygenase family protein [Longispora sp. NPDC051575]|uniref:cysteine dioxygenase family protein n=1 Tax=Longispora sp. NPDC051575 TaxID=3154943 RepID=UPI003440EC9C
MSTRLLSPVAARLVGDLRAAVAAGPARVTRTLARYLGADDLLGADQRIPDPTAYRQHVLHVEDDGSFSLVALVWLPGQATCVHDHVSWCVVGTYVGEEEETAYRLAGDHLVPVRTTRTPQGVASFLVPPGDIHSVRNNSDALAISLHVYGADIGVLGSSVRRRYDLPIHQG